MGNTAEKIEAALKEIGSSVETVRVSDMEKAVSLAGARAKDGDVVLMSPASASFDKYKNFEERGKHFKKLVCDL